MWTKEQLKESLSSVEMAINIQTEVNPDNPSSHINKLNTISNVMGLAVKCVGEGEALYTSSLSKETAEIMLSLPNIGSNERKIFVNGKMGEYIELYTRADKLNKALKDCSDNLRTLISYAKHELNLTKEMD